MKILRALPIDYVVVEFQNDERLNAPIATDPVLRRMVKSWPDYACAKVLHLDDVPQSVIDDYVNNYTH